MTQFGQPSRYDYQGMATTPLLRNNLNTDPYGSCCAFAVTVPDVFQGSVDCETWLLSLANWGNEIIIHQSGCIVKAQIEGRGSIFDTLTIAVNNDTNLKVVNKKLQSFTK